MLGGRGPDSDCGSAAWTAGVDKDSNKANVKNGCSLFGLLRGALLS
jgi:hypothetical protein